MLAMSVGLLRSSLLRLCVLAAVATPAAAQPEDPNAPYKDAYDVLHGEDLVGEWQGTISGSSVSQGDGRIGGQAKFVTRGYEGKETFGLILHDHRNRDGLGFSEISIGSIPCGPDELQSPMVHGLQLKDAPAGSATLLFQNAVAQTRQPGMRVHPQYAPTADKPATLQTRWTDDALSLTVSGELKSVVAPVQGAVFDYERQREGRLESLRLDLEFNLPRTLETEAFYQSTLCRETEKFEVVDTTPALGKANVLLTGAEFDFVFSEDLYEDSLRSFTIDFETFGANGFPIEVEADYSLVDSKTLRVTPTEPLLPGTIYEIEIKSGRYGVLGMEGETLEDPFILSFSTMVDPESLRLDIYQVSRNATLVNGKPAAARLYVDWEERDDVDPDYQVKSYPVEIEIRDSGDRPIFPKRTREAFRPDQFTDEERRLGQDSFNLFGWTPTSSEQPDEFVAHVLPHDYYPQDVELEPETVERDMEYADQHIDRLTVDYFIAVHTQWLPDGPDEAAVRQVMQSMNKERAFANQILPVARVSANYRGTYDVADTMCSIPGMGATICKDGFVRRPWGSPVSQAEGGKWSNFLRLFYEHVGAMSSADILVSFHPPMSGGGQANSRFEQPDGLKVEEGGTYENAPDAPLLMDLFNPEGTSGNVIAMSTAGFRAGNRAAVFTAPLVVHEFGHVFSLPHIPYARDEAHRAELCEAGLKQTATGIDGMRISLNGSAGAAKSSETGNAESKYPLLNLMLPCIYEPRRRYWIDGEQYEWLVDRMPGMLRMTRARHALRDAGPEATRHASDKSARPRSPHEGLLWQASFNQVDMNEAENWVMVSGFIDEGSAVLLPTVRTAGPRQRLAGKDGPYEIRIENDNGRVLARTSIGQDAGTADGLESWAFAATLPVSAQPARITLSLDEKVLAERRANPRLAAPRFTSHNRGVVYESGDRLEWSAEGAISYTVRFTPDGEDWSTLSVLLGEPAFTPDPATLRPGPDAAFEVIAHDGVNERSSQLAVTVDVPFEPLVTVPEIGEQGEPVEAAELVFNVALDPESLDAIRLLDSTGRDTPALITLGPSGATVSIEPAEAEVQAGYTVIADTSLQALDGRALASRQEVPFTALARPSTRLTMPEGRVLSDVKKAPSPATDQKGDPGPAGAGEITLGLAEPVTLPARILDCESGKDDSSASIEFQTNPGASQRLTLERSEEGKIALHLDQGGSKKIAYSGTEGEDWALEIESGAVTGRGIIAVQTMRASVQFSGKCPAR
jgi:Big-like domain-containing protein